MRVELPEGNWAELRDPEDLYEEDRKAVAKRAVFEFNGDNNTRILRGDVENNLADALLARVVEAWSYTNLKIPSKDIHSLDKLKISHARALREGIAPHFKVLNGTEDVEEEDQDPMVSAS